MPRSRTIATGKKIFNFAPFTVASQFREIKNEREGRERERDGQKIRKCPSERSRKDLLSPSSYGKGKKPWKRESGEKRSRIHFFHILWPIIHHFCRQPNRNELTRERRGRRIFCGALEHNDVLFFHTGQKLRRKGERFLRQMGWAGEEEEERKKWPPYSGVRL